MQEQGDAGLSAWYRRHRWVVDPIAMALLAIVMAALGFRSIWASFSVIPDGVSPWWALTLALPACALALIKRRAPVTVLTVVTILFVIDLLTVGGIGTLVVLLDVLWTAAFVAGPRGRRVLLILLGGATLALFVAALAFARVDFAVAFLIAVQFGAIFGTDYWWAVAVSQANELTELHRQRADEAAAVAERDQAEAVRKERETMARELHDVVAGHVMAMAIRAEAALSTAPDQAKDRDALQAVRDAGLDAHGALRSMITVLRRGDGRLSPTPRWSDLERILGDARRAGLSIRFSSDDLDELGGAAEQAVVRVVREALTNCTRHASGADVDVVIAMKEEDLRVVVRSRGGEAAPSVARGDQGWGLQMLRERVVALGGAFTAGPDSDGWAVEARIPTGVRA
ncbi:sensor histidine kinase [Microbacterium sp. PMB16]|uniref:sensor histidine kinase n=1 Tax=Microbacterium sp. PMB16 TaxID=3120157 RepID=UPI003F4B12A2